VSGSGTPTLVLTGSLADINAELAMLGYRSAATGTEPLDVTVYDGAGFLSDAQTAVTT
jgi:hypothetical protein